MRWILNAEVAKNAEENLNLGVRLISCKTVKASHHRVTEVTEKGLTLGKN